MSPDISVVDLFCGAGGLTCGFEDAGINVTAGVDVDEDCAYPYQTNNDAEFLNINLATVAQENPSRIADLFDPDADVRVLAGCPPCQPFSSLTNGTESEDHQNAGLVAAFGELVAVLEPEMVVMENVYGVTNDDGYREAERRLRDAGYNFNPKPDRRVHCPGWHVPQSRRRCVTLASRDGMPDLGDPPLAEGEYNTVRETIDDLSPIEAGQVHDDDHLHRSRHLSDLNRRRIQNSVPGGTWEDWPDELMLDCHSRESGESFRSVYGRMLPDEPAPTITTQFYNLGSGRFGHYDTDQDRALSLREGAMLQTFPRDYRFVPEGEEVHFAEVGRWIGNAVPPALGAEIGRRLKEFLTGVDRQEAISDYPV